MPIKEALYVPSKRRHQRKLEQLKQLKVHRDAGLTTKDIAIQMELPVNYVTYLIREQNKHEQNIVMKEYVQGLLLNQFSFEEIQAATNLTDLKLTFLYLFYEVDTGLFNEDIIVSTILHESRNRDIKEVAKKMNVHFSTIKNIVELDKLERAIDDWESQEKETVFQYSELVQLEKPFFLTNTESYYFESLILRLIKDNQCGYQRIQKIFGFNSTDAQTIVNYCLRNENVEVNRNWRYPNALVEKIRADYEKGMSNREIEEKYSLTRNQFKGFRAHYKLTK